MDALDGTFFIDTRVKNWRPRFHKPSSKSSAADGAGTNTKFRSDAGRTAEFKRRAKKLGIDLYTWTTTASGMNTASDSE
jgi:hypothetical protein